MAARVSREESVVLHSTCSSESAAAAPPTNERKFMAIVTGVSQGGIGYATAKALADQGAHVILAGRKERAEVRLAIIL